MNIAPVAPEVYEEVGPYIDLSEKLGAMVAQLARGGVESLEIKFVGKLAETDTRILKTAVLKGMLTIVSAESVNFVNADYYAEQRGIQVTETKRSETHDYISMVIVQAGTPEGMVDIGAALVGKGNDPRLVSLYGQDMDMAPSQYMAFFKYEDKPGIIGKVGSILGDHRINIGSMQVGRTEAGGEALMGITVDSAIASDLLEQIKEDAGLSDAWSVEL